MEMKALIGIPSPRDIESFAKSTKLLDFCDKIWIKYMEPEKKAYDLIRNYFLANSEYTHLVILPDDLIVTVAQFKSLMKSVQDFDYPVLGGVANIDATPNGMNFFSMSFNMIHADRNKRFAKLVTKTELDELAKGGIVRVLWSGFPCMFIRRDVVEKIEFNNDGKYIEGLDGFHGCCADTVFCYECYQNKIRIHVDPRIIMPHLRFNQEEKDSWRVGSLPPKVYLEKSTVN